MAINRGPWNALVDDDGSNLVGSIWNKAAIKTVLLDPIDAQVVPLTSVPLNPATFTANVGAWTVTAAGVLYGIDANRIMDLFIRVNSSTLTGAASSLLMTIPGGYTTHGNAPPLGCAMVNHAGGGFEIGFALAPPGLTIIEIHRNGLAAYGVGALDAYVTLRIPLA